MSFILSTRAEMRKVKRTASFWLSILAAVFVPALFTLIIIFNSTDNALKRLEVEPWKNLFYLGWEFFAAFALPMYIILVTTLVAQIEVKNNTWKQVFASPQSVSDIYFSKFAAIQLLILSSFVLFNLFMIGVGIVANLIHPRFPFLEERIDLVLLFWLCFKVYLSIAGITAIQYCVALRFKNFVAPVGIGLALVIGGVMALGFNWAHIYKYPYVYPVFTSDLVKDANRPFIENHEWNSIGYFVAFLGLGLLDMSLRKEKG